MPFSGRKTISGRTTDYLNPINPPIGTRVHPVYLHDRFLKLLCRRPLLDLQYDR